MGCSNGRPMSGRRSDSTVPMVVDPRLPFTQAQIKTIRSVWNLVKRKFEDSARENLVIFFHLNPIFQDLFPHLNDLKSEQDMRHSPVFMMQALAIFGVYDDVIEGLTHDVDGAIAKLEEVGRLHAKIDAFHVDFFQDGRCVGNKCHQAALTFSALFVREYVVTIQMRSSVVTLFMEEPFIQTLRENFADDFQDAEIELYRLLFHWMQAVMTTSIETGNFGCEDPSAVFCLSNIYLYTFLAHTQEARGLLTRQ
ncbi:hypothetical protein CAPTEDRAFT_193618 [Capitella teleta]|uniref:Globin domain-containing protein n=1 Tax=Capitella teleta TaxID=283909 RepID=R7VJJ1_CAPTE|nr:hypothetical protein CAPTEDRAFT_193618 [Capitella teleta]|eukprot:ELU15965.1 hypothetical protein CAPTEDRAFT_193618 [Capitella teleta]